MKWLSNRETGRIEIQNKSTYLCAALIFIAVLVFFAATRTATSGFHFVDDWGRMSIRDYLNSHSLSSTIVNEVQSDLDIRFRPLHWTHIVLETFVFGINFKYISFYRIALCEVTMLLFFFGMRKLHFSNILSVLFLCLTFLGPQMAIWWRLGPNETIGMVFLALCFYVSIPESTEEGIKHFVLNSILFVIFALLSSLCKESFIVSIPAMCFMRVAFIHKETKYTWKKSVYICLPAIILLLAAMAAELLIIMNIGIHGYGGVSNSLRKVIEDCADLIFKNEYLKVYAGFVFIVICAYVISNRSKEKFVSMIKEVLPYFIISALIICPNIFLYSKSGLWERYLLPTSLGFALSICALLSHIGKKDLFFSLFLTAALSVLYVPANLWCAFEAGVSFKREGVRTARFLKTVKDNMGEGDVLLISHPVRRSELTCSFRTYMRLINNKTVYCQQPVDCDIEGNGGGAVQNGIEEMKAEPSVIAGFDERDVEKTIEYYYPDSGYVNISKNRYPVFVKK